MRFYYLSAVELHLMITRVGTSGILLSHRYGFIPLYLSVATITLKFLHVSVFRVVSPIERYTYARRFTCRFLHSQSYSKQWQIIGFLNSKYPKGSLAYWILEGHTTLSLLVVLQTVNPISVYITKVWEEWSYWGDLSREVTYFPKLLSSYFLDLGKYAPILGMSPP